MAENSDTDNEDIENPILDPEKISDESTSSDESQATNLNQESENMETHAHHLHRAPGKKKWHYFYEFLMLFFAVFCGFLAENWREHYVEGKREKEYARQLLADLRADSVFYAQASINYPKIITKQNAFIQLMSSATPPTDKEVIKSFAPLQWIDIVRKNPSTYNQMKFSGSIRYIRNKELAASIQKYYEVHVPFIDTFSDENLSIYNNYIQPFSLEHFTKGDIDINTDSLTTQNPIYRNRTADSDFRLRNIVFLYKEYLSTMLERVLIPHIENINKQIDMIKKEYDLE